MIRFTRFFALTLFFLFPLHLFSQKQFPQKPLTDAEATMLSNLPDLELPESLKVTDLPWRCDNADQPYLRPVFEQIGASCGQAAGVSYNFTYEINRARGLSADTSVNQYPTHFTYNFMNHYGYYGVSYLHSFEILRTLGSPTVEEYGGMAINEDANIWVSGYDLYHGAMANRIKSVSQIKVNTPEGLLTLKHWLHNHLENSETGGIVSFYAGSPWAYKTLPPESYDAGAKVMVNFYGSQATHAMTIVGYNDSIRYDYNEDGQFTNNIDLNGDGILNMKDWEIGGVRFVNSYGDDWADTGYCYMMYKVLADELADGGIWNHAVHALDVDAEYSPELTMKLKIKHDSREKIRIMAGVSADTAMGQPQHLLGFPVFDFQGANQYMQGGRQDPANKIIEIGLDITPLLSRVNPGKPAKFFVVVVENDPDSEGTGMIMSYSIIDYNAAGMEIPCPQEDVPINDNATTRLSVTHQPEFDKVNITTSGLPAAVAGQNYEVQLEAEGGTAPYQWKMTPEFHQQKFNTDFPVIDQEQLYPEPVYEKWAVQALDFGFPLYGESFDTVYMHRGGFLMFDDDLLPWPYFNDPYIMFKKSKMVSGFLFSPVQYYPEPFRSEELWFEGDETYAAFRWKHPLMFFDQEIGYGEYAVILYPDGRVEFYFNDIQVNEDVIWYGGVSAGDGHSVEMISNSNSNVLPQFSGFSLKPELPPDELSLSEDGLLTGTPGVTGKIHNLYFTATDDHRIFSSKKLQFSDGLIFNWALQAGSDSVVYSGEEFSIDLTVKNIYSEPFNNVMAELDFDDPHLEIINGAATVGNISAGQEITIENAFTLKVDKNCPDRYGFFGEMELSSDEADWTGYIDFESYAPAFLLDRYFVDDNDNFKLDPGETTDIYIQLINNGFADATDVEFVFDSPDDYIAINNPVFNAGQVGSGQMAGENFSVTVDEATPISHVAQFVLSVNYNNGLETEFGFDLSIGQWPVLVINKADDTNSCDALIESLNALNVEHQFSDTLPAQLGLYRSVFVCLGTFYASTGLTQNEGTLLAAYLDEGGKLYMEGSLTWHLQPQTLVHERFGFDVENVTWFEFDELTGIAGTFTEGLIFDFSGEYNLVPCYMLPQSTAFPVLSVDGSDVYYTAVANEQNDYKTLGAIFEFGSMGGENAMQGRNDYLTGILEFFGLEDYIVGTGPDYFVSKKLDITAAPNPFREEVAFEIVLQESADITVNIFDLSGQLVRQVENKRKMPQGINKITWDGRDDYGRCMPPGIYIYRVEVPELNHTGKIIRMD